MYDIVRKYVVCINVCMYICMHEWASETLQGILLGLCGGDQQQLT